MGPAIAAKRETSSTYHNKNFGTLNFKPSTQYRKATFVQDKVNASRHAVLHLTSSQRIDFERKFSQVEVERIIWLPLKSGNADSIVCVATIDAI